MAIQGFQLAWIVVTDLEKAIKFYTEVLGFKLEERSDEFGWAELTGPNGGARLGLAEDSEHSPVRPGSNAVVTLTVSDIKKSKEELSKKGTKMLGDIMEVPGEVKMQMFQDADGNKFQLVELLRKGQD